MNGLLHLSLRAHAIIHNNSDNKKKFYILNNGTHVDATLWIRAETRPRFGWNSIRMSSFPRERLQFDPTLLCLWRLTSNIEKEYPVTNSNLSTDWWWKEFKMTPRKRRLYKSATVVFVSCAVGPLVYSITDFNNNKISEFIRQRIFMGFLQLSTKRTVIVNM